MSKNSTYFPSFNHSDHCLFGVVLIRCCSLLVLELLRSFSNDDGKSHLKKKHLRSCDFAIIPSSFNSTMLEERYNRTLRSAVQVNTELKELLLYAYVVVKAANRELKQATLLSHGQTSEVYISHARLLVSPRFFN